MTVPGVLSRWFLLVGIPSAVACVTIDDPEHCANRDGDATCRMLNYDRAVCSLCRRTFSGCQDEPVEAACRFTPASETSSSTSSSTSSDDSGSTNTGVPMECDGAGASAMCPDDRPYCMSGECAGCESAGGDGFCASLGVETPQCSPAWGRCVECVDDASPVCVAAESVCTTSFTCGGCTRQAQCPLSACNVFTGECMASAVQVWVSSGDASCNDSNAGTDGAPVCTVAEALERVDTGGSGVIHLANGNYDDWDLAACSERTIVVRGESQTLTILANSTAAGANVGCNNTAIFANVRIRGNTTSALDCTGGKLALESVFVDEGDPVGIAADDCDLVIDRSRVLGASTSAVRAVGASSLQLRASLLTIDLTSDTAAASVQLTNTSFDIRFSTIVGGAPAGGALTCVDSTGTVHSAILASPLATESIDCPALDVTFDHCVVDDSRVLGEDNLMTAYDPAWFLDSPADLRLGPGASELGAVGRWDLGDPAFDYDGDPWPLPPASPSYPGGDQGPE